MFAYSSHSSEALGVPRPTLATVPSPATSASCCMLVWWDLQPFSATQQSAAPAGEAGALLPSIYPLFCSRWQVFTAHAFKGFHSFFGNQKADLTLVWRDTCLSSVHLSGLVFSKNQGTVRVKLWQIVWSFYYHVQFSNFHNLDLNETVLILCQHVKWM